MASGGIVGLERDEMSLLFLPSGCPSRRHSVSLVIYHIRLRGNTDRIPVRHKIKKIAL